MGSEALNSMPFLSRRKGGFSMAGKVEFEASRCTKKSSFLQEGGVSKGKKQGFLQFRAQSLDFFVILHGKSKENCKKCFRSTFLLIVYHQRHIEMAGQKVS